MFFRVLTSRARSTSGHDREGERSEKEFATVHGVQLAIALTNKFTLVTGNTRGDWGSNLQDTIKPQIHLRGAGLVRLGITCPATLKYKNEEEILAKQAEPEKYNREVIFPDKVRLDREYVENYRFGKDSKYIFQTIFG